MFKAAFESFALLELPGLAMAVFMVTFAVVVVRSLRPRPAQRSRDEHLANLPLLDDQLFDDTVAVGERHV